MISLDPAFWCDRAVLLTGHTGFKGAWLSLWLQSLGAHVTGLSLAPSTEPSLYELAAVGDGMVASSLCDIRDAPAVTRAVEAAKPELVIHMAAQSLVRRSFAAPLETYETNVMGTANLLDAVGVCGGVRAVIVVTSDKCYAPAASLHPHREDDSLGGNDPYSSSKAAAELVTNAYRSSFFSDPSSPRVASARAGNVIGGGDWGEDRLIPDIVRCASAGETLRLRNPSAVRPWQHVLCPLSGYLTLAEALFRSPDYACAWNFGPEAGDARTVEQVVQGIVKLWSGDVPWESDQRQHPPESGYLEIDSSRARKLLGWSPPMSLEEGFDATVRWFQAFAEGQDMREVTLAQIQGRPVWNSPASTALRRRTL